MNDATPPTPETFAAALRAIYPANGEYDRESAHMRADGLMIAVLRALGYGEGCDTFEAAARWYA